MIRYIKGDLIDMAQKNYFDIIVHGCNCFCTMGAGIAKRIKKEFPEAYYRADLATKRGDRSKLGQYSFCECKTKLDAPILIVNAYTQFEYGGNHRHVDYEAIEKALHRLSIHTNQTQRIGMPKIGCGLAGGEWSIVEEIIDRIFHDREVTVVEYNNNNKEF